MKTFDEYVDGAWVVYKNPNHNWHLMQFQAYKSKYTHNAFRLKYGDREVIADISEIEPVSHINDLMQGQYENSNRDLQSNHNGKRQEEKDWLYSDVQD